MQRWLDGSSKHERLCWFDAHSIECVTLQTGKHTSADARVSSIQATRETDGQKEQTEAREMETDRETTTIAQSSSKSSNIQQHSASSASILHSLNHRPCLSESTSPLLPVLLAHSFSFLTHYSFSQAARVNVAWRRASRLNVAAVSEVRDRTEGVREGIIGQILNLHIGLTSRPAWPYPERAEPQHRSPTQLLPRLRTLQLDELKSRDKSSKEPETAVELQLWLVWLNQMAPIAPISTLIISPQYLCHRLITEPPSFEWLASMNHLTSLHLTHNYVSSSLVDILPRMHGLMSLHIPVVVVDAASAVEFLGGVRAESTIEKNQEHARQLLINVAAHPTLTKLTLELHVASMPISFDFPYLFSFAAPVFVHITHLTLVNPHDEDVDAFSTISNQFPSLKEFELRQGYGFDTDGERDERTALAISWTSHLISTLAVGLSTLLSSSLTVFSLRIRTGAQAERNILDLNAFQTRSVDVDELKPLWKKIEAPNAASKTEEKGLDTAASEAIAVQPRASTCILSLERFDLTVDAVGARFSPIALCAMSIHMPQLRSLKTQVRTPHELAMVLNHAHLERLSLHGATTRTNRQFEREDANTSFQPRHIQHLRIQGAVIERIGSVFLRSLPSCDVMAVHSPLISLVALFEYAQHMPLAFRPARSAIGDKGTFDMLPVSMEHFCIDHSAEVIEEYRLDTLPANDPFRIAYNAAILSCSSSASHRAMNKIRGTIRWRKVILYETTPADNKVNMRPFIGVYQNRLLRLVDRHPTIQRAHMQLMRRFDDINLRDG